MGKTSQYSCSVPEVVVVVLVGEDDVERLEIQVEDALAVDELNTAHHLSTIIRTISALPINSQPTTAEPGTCPATDNLATTRPDIATIVMFTHSPRILIN